MRSINDLFPLLQYEVKDASLFRRALTHRSYSLDHNERLEFLGDAVLDIVISEVLYHQFTDKPEGELTRFRAELVRASTLADIAKELDLKALLMLGEGERKAGGAGRESILSGTLEALVGAIYLDSNYQTCKDVVIRIFAKRLQDIEKNAPQKDAKTTLQELMQARNRELPQYTLVKTSGQDHAQTFTISCILKALGKMVEADGTSKKIAEQNAARAMLTMLEQEKNL